MRALWLGLVIGCTNDFGSLVPASTTAYRDAVIADAPIGYFRLGETSGEIASDLGGNRPGYYRRTVTLGVPGAIRTDDDMAIAFGSDGYVDLGDRFDFPGTAPFSLELWITPTALDGVYRFPFWKEDGNGGQRNGYGLAMINGDLLFERYVGGNNLPAFAFAKVTTGKTAYVVCTYDGAKLELYVDAVKAGEARDERPLADVVAPALLGTYTTTNGQSLLAQLDEVAIYDKVLSIERIQAHYAAGR
jgi:hypothetical protein